jgi:sortase B
LRKVEKRIDKAIAIAKFIDNVVSKASTLIWILVLCLASYAMYDTYSVYDKANDRSLLRYKPQTKITDTDGEPAVIPNSVAWLTLDDSPIDYPVMQGGDNNEYLNKDPFGDFSLAGSIFLDYRNAKDFSDYYSLLYGHHMEHEAMFGALDHWKDQEYFDSHRTGTLIIGNKEYKLKIFAVLNCMSYDEEVFYPFNKENILSYLKQKAAIYEEPDVSGRLLAMTTCAVTPSEARLAVFAIIDDGEA